MSAEAPDAARVAVHLAAALRDAGVPYAIGGAVAYGFWGNPRGTHDVDLNLFVPAERAAPALGVLAGAGLSMDEREVLRRAEERGDARVRYGDMPVDLFFLSIPLHESADARAVEIELLGERVRILSAEDLTVFKLLFFRGKDVVDVERIVAVRGSALDRSYVRRWLVDAVGENDARVAKWDEICSALPPSPTE